MSERKLTGRTRFRLMSYGFLKRKTVVVLQVEESWNEPEYRGNHVAVEPRKGWRDAQPLDIFNRPDLRKGREYRLILYGLPGFKKSAFALQVEYKFENVNFKQQTSLRDATPSDVR